MSEEDSSMAALTSALAKRDEAIAAHEALRRSEGFKVASGRSVGLASDYALGLRALSAMSMRWDGFRQTRLNLRSHDLLLESAFSIQWLIQEGMLNPARREMRFLLEASIKAWWCDSCQPNGEVAAKLEILDDLGASRFRDIVASIEPRLLDQTAKDEFLYIVTNLYARLSTNVHASTGGIGVALRRFERGRYVGFESVADVNEANELFAQVLDVSLAAAFESFEEGLVGDIFVVVLDDAKWKFRKTPFVGGILRHFDYKFERHEEPGA